MNILTKVKSGSALFWRTEKNSPRSLSTNHAAFEITLLFFTLHIMALPGSAGFGQTSLTDPLVSKVQRAETRASALQSPRKTDHCRPCQTSEEWLE